MQKTHITHLNFAKGFRGGERQTQLLIEQLSRFGYYQTLIVRENSPLISRCNTIQNVIIYTIKKPYVFHLALVKNAQIIHAHETKAAHFALFADILFKIPYFVTRRVNNYPTDNMLNKHIYSRAVYTIALSTSVKNKIKQVIPKSNTTIIPSAYSTIKPHKENVNQIKQTYKNRYLIGHVGALADKDKGQLFIIKAARELIHTHPDIHFLLLGSGEDEKILKEEAKDLTNITFEGFVTNVNDYIAAFDLFVFPSRNEGLGSTLLDVMHQSIPIIASRVGGIPDIITNSKNGLLFDIDTPKQLIQKIVHLYRDRNFAQELARQAAIDAANYSPFQMAKQYAKLYKQL